ncbi:sensor histidine kinase [Mesorhizobium japonicum]|uniref:sensor histidine kinase n=1 Tax=Mesorhizobium japonicum TaxID=2066070 RepID=UPI003B5C3099
MITNHLKQQLQHKLPAEIALLGGSLKKISWSFLIGLNLFFCYQGISCAENFLSPSAVFNTQINYCSSSKDLSFSEATQCNFEGIDKLPTSSALRNSTWVRLEIKSSEYKINSALIHIRPHFINNVEVFQNINKEWTSQIGGNQFPISNLHAAIGGYDFVVSLNPTISNFYYLKIASPGLTNAAVIEAEPWPPGNFRNLNQQIGLGVHLGGLSLIVLFAFLSYFLQPNLLMGRFSISILNTLLGTLAGSGLLAYLLFPENPKLDKIVFISILCARIGLWVWVCRAMLLPYQTPKWYAKICNALYLLAACSMLAAILDKHSIFQALLFLGFAASSLLQIPAILRTPDIQPNLRAVFLIGFSAITSLALAVPLMASFIPSFNPYLIYITRAADFMNPLILLSIIMFNNRLIFNEFNKVKFALAKSEVYAKSKEKQIHERQVLIDLLSHEIKNPLAAISLATHSLKNRFSSLRDVSENKRFLNIDRSIQNINKVIDKCRLMNKLDQEYFDLQIENIHLKKFLESLVSDQDNADRIQFIQIDDISIQSDAYFLSAIIGNLLDNALKYSTPDSLINLTAKIIQNDDKNLLSILVENKINSSWSPNPKLIFTRYYRHPLAPAQSGAGIGLYITKEIVQTLNGSISINQTHDVIQFTIEIPV